MRGSKSGFIDAEGLSSLYIYNWFLYTLCAFFYFVHACFAYTFEFHGIHTFGECQTVFCLQFELQGRNDRYVFPKHYGNFRTAVWRQEQRTSGWLKRKFWSPKSHRQCCSTLMPWQWIMSSSLEGSWLQIQIDGMMLAAGACPQAVLTHSAVLSGSFQIILHSLHFRFMDSWFQNFFFFLLVPTCNDIFMMGRVSIQISWVTIRPACTFIFLKGCDIWTGILQHISRIIIFDWLVLIIRCIMYYWRANTFNLLKNTHYLHVLFVKYYC